MISRYLVTGAQGFLGRYVIAALLRSDPKAMVLGVGRSAREDTLFTHTIRWIDEEIAAPVPREVCDHLNDKRYEYQTVDVGQMQAVAAAATAFRPDVVLHLAASLRDESWSRLIENNIRPALALVEGLAAAGLRPRVVFGSTGSVYGQPDGGAAPFNERSNCRPLDPYAASKRAAEDIGRVAGMRYGLNVVAARLFNLVGPGLQERHLCAALARQIVLIERDQVEPAIRVGPLTASRDFIDVRDAARALLLLASLDEPYEIYNVGSGVARVSAEVLTALVDHSNFRAEMTIDPQPGRAADSPHLAGDITRLRALGFVPAFSFAGSLGDMLDYYRSLPSRTPR